MELQLQLKNQYITVDNGILTGYRSDNQIPGQQKETEIFYSEGGFGGFLITGNPVENPPIYRFDGVPLYKWDGATILLRTEAELNNLAANN